MARYSIGFEKTTAAAAGLIAQLRCPSTADARVIHVSVAAVTGVAGKFQLIRSTAVGSGFTSLTPQPEDPKSAATGAALDTAATTAPTLATVALRTFQLPATIGAGVFWEWQPDRGIFVPSNGSLVLWQLSTAAVTYAVTIVYED